MMSSTSFDDSFTLKKIPFSCCKAFAPCWCCACGGGDDCGGGSCFSETSPVGVACLAIGGRGSAEPEAAGGILSKDDRDGTELPAKEESFLVPAIDVCGTCREAVTTDPSTLPPVLPP